MAVPYPQPVAAIQAEEAQSEDEGGEVVAAMPARKQPTNKQSGQQGNYKGWQSQQATGGKAGKVMYLCFKHAKFGEGAFNCTDKKNCTWL